MRSNEEGLVAKDSADVKFEIEEPTAEQQSQAQALAASQAAAQAARPAQGQGPQDSYALAGGLRRKPVGPSDDVPSYNNLGQGQFTQQNNVDEIQDEQQILSQQPARPAPRPAQRQPVKGILPPPPAPRPQPARPLPPAKRPPPPPPAPRPQPARPLPPAKRPPPPPSRPQAPRPLPPVQRAPQPPPVIRPPPPPQQFEVSFT